MSNNESSSSDVEVVDTQDLVPYQEQESTSGELLPPSSQELSELSLLQQLRLGQSNELALPASGASALSNSGDNIITGGEFPNAILGSVTQHNKLAYKPNVTQIENQEIHHHHHHHYGSERSSDISEEPSTSQASQESKELDALILNGSIKMFKNQKLHKTKHIYKGEKATATNPIPIAVKLMDYSKTALREAKCFHSLEFHPNVVRIYDSGIYNTNIQFVFIAMELCSPETLFDYVRNSKNPNHVQAIRHSNQIISGLEYIHEKGIAHRDLKPQNILFCATGGYDQVKISDFGLSKNYQISQTTTVAGMVSGTVGYMAPELINEEKPNDPTKCDIFSLGIVLVFRLSDGKHPYGEKYFDWTPNIARGRDPNLDDIWFPNKKQTNDIKRLISKMLQHSPENRPTAQDLMEEWNKDVGDSVEEIWIEPHVERGVHHTSSAPKHREETNGEEESSESGRIFQTDMETRIKEVGGMESPETSMANITQTNSPLSIALHQRALFHGTEDSPWASYMTKPFRPGAQTLRDTEPRTSQISAQTDTRKNRVVGNESLETSIVSRIQSPMNVLFENSDLSRKMKSLWSTFKHKLFSNKLSGMFGITKKDEQLVYWKDIEQLTSDPRVITKLPVSVGFYSVVAGDCCIYMVGPTTCYRFDLDNADRGWIRLGSMKHDHGWLPPAAVLNGKLYVCGKRSNASNQCEVFTGQWSEIAPMKNLRNYHYIVSLDGFLYSIGGRDEKSNRLCSVEKYDPSTNTWEIIQPMNVAREDAKAVVYNGKIYVWGVFVGKFEQLVSCECFDPSTSTWTLSTSDWWKTNKSLYPFVFDNKVLSLLKRWELGYDTIQQVPLGNDSETDLIKVKLPERWTLRSILAVE